MRHKSFSRKMKTAILLLLSFLFFATSAFGQSEDAFVLVDPFAKIADSDPEFHVDASGSDVLDAENPAEADSIGAEPVHADSDPTGAEQIGAESAGKESGNADADADEPAGSDPADAQRSGQEPEGELYPEITSQSEWYLGRLIASHRITGVRLGHRSAVESVFRKYENQPFTYDLLSDLQRELYATGYFESFNPQVDIDADKNLVLVFDFSEIPVIRSISFIAENILDKLSYDDGILRSKTGLAVGESRTRSEIEGSSRLIRDFYAEEGRPDTYVSIGLYTDKEKGENSIVYTIREGAEKRIGQVVFEGNGSFSEQTLLKNIATKVSTSKKNGFYLERSFGEDISKLLEFYRKNGYKDAEVTGPSVEPVDLGRGDGAQYFRLTYSIKEGQPWRFAGVSFSGNTLFDDDRLESRLAFKPGDAYDYEKAKASSDAILDDYYNEGYIYASVDAQTEENGEELTVGVMFVVNEESQCFIERVLVSGNAATEDQVFLREMAFNEGDIFSREKIQQSFQNVYNTGLVKNLDYNLTPGSDRNHLVLEMIIEEAQFMDVSFGMTFGGSEGGFPLSFIASFNNKNFLKKANAISVSANVSTDYQSIGLSFSAPWFRNIRWSNSFNLSFERSVKSNALQRNPDSDFQIGRNNAFPLGYASYEDYEAYDETVPALRYLMKYDMYRLSLGYSTGYTWVFGGVGRLSVSGGLSFGINHAVYDPNEYMPFEYLIEQYRQGWQFSNRLYAGLTWDGRDFVEDTTSGYMVSQNFTYAGGILGGLSNYMRSSTTLSGYLALFKTGDRIKPTALVGSLTTSLHLMLPQFYSTALDGGDTSWRWHDPKLGATRSEMIYIDGMRVARGHSYVYDISFMWDSMFELSYPIVNGIVNAEAFASMTAASKQLDSISSNLTWYGAIGIGVKLKISGFPLGVYLVGDYKIRNSEVTWIDGGLFNYVHPVVAISTSLI